MSEYQVPPGYGYGRNRNFEFRPGYGRNLNLSFGRVTATAECALVSVGLYSRHHDVQPERMNREIYKARHRNISQNSEITPALPDLSSTCLQTILLSSSFCFLSLQARYIQLPIVL